MKYAFFLLLPILAIVACDPPKDVVQQGNFTFSARVVNPRDTINLGDSVCFIFEIPDTINLNGSIKIATSYGGNDGINLSLEDNKMDTSLGGESRGFTPDCDTYASPGSISGGLSLNLGRLGNKFYSKLYFIPRKKGVYFLSTPQIGYFSINNETVKGRVFFTIDVPDKHHTLLINTARPQNRAAFAAFIQSEEGKRQPIYGFAVK
jgi:hypothetical protein